jgi:hypothetical protein
MRPTLASPPLLLLLLVACTGDDTPARDAAPGTSDAATDASNTSIDAADDPGAGLLRVEGVAEAMEEGSAVRIECAFWADIGAIVESDTGWTGTVFAGEVFRRSFDGDAPLFEFQALIGGGASLDETAGGVEVRVAGDQPDDAAPFWRALEVLEGTATGEHTAGGAWTCAPVLPPDSRLQDPQLDGAGTWTIGPAP